MAKKKRMEKEIHLADLPTVDTTTGEVQEPATTDVPNTEVTAPWKPTPLDITNIPRKSKLDWCGCLLGGMPATINTYVVDTPRTTTEIVRLMTADGHNVDQEKVSKHCKHWGKRGKMELRDGGWARKTPATGT